MPSDMDRMKLARCYKQHGLADGESAFLEELRHLKGVDVVIAIPEQDTTPKPSPFTDYVFHMRQSDVLNP